MIVKRHDVMNMNEDHRKAQYLYLDNTIQHTFRSKPAKKNKKVVEEATLQAKLKMLDGALSEL
jgi:hypothetical protein